MNRAKLLGEENLPKWLSRVKVTGPIPCLSLVTQNSAFPPLEDKVSEVHRHFCLSFVTFLVDVWNQCHLEIIGLFKEIEAVVHVLSFFSKNHIYFLSMKQSCLERLEPQWNTQSEPSVHPRRLSPDDEPGDSLRIYIFDITWHGHPSRP